MKIRTRIAATMILASMLPACVRRPAEPQLASSAAQPGYAEQYPYELQETRKRLDAQEEQARGLMGRFAEYPDELENPTSWEQVRGVVDLADREGRSQHYVEHLERLAAVASFFAEEQKELSRRVGGAAQHAAKQKGCDADVASPAAYALQKTVEKRLEERLHERSDAHAAIEHDGAVLGEKNSEKLEEQADEIARASYLVHVGVVRSKQRLDQMIEELSEVQSTLDRMIEDLENRAAAPDLSPEAKKENELRLAAAQTSRSTVEGEVDAAKEAARAAEQRIEALQQEYSEALDALRAELRKREAETPGDGTPQAS